MQQYFFDGGAELLAESGIGIAQIVDYEMANPVEFQCGK